MRLVLLSLFSIGLAASAQGDDAIAARDARRLKQGTFFYHDLEHGKEVGKSSITIRKLPDSGNYRFSNDATFTAEFSGFHSQRWQAIATADFVPVSAALEFVGETQPSPIFELQYAGRRVHGFVVERKPSTPPARRLVDDTILQDTVDQRIDWAAAISGPLMAGGRLEFGVYDPNTGVSRVIERIGNRETIKTPAGAFSAIRIVYDVEKRGRVERYVVFTTREQPRVMIREDFPNGVVTELVAMSD
jgi:hypothetical protein